MYLIFIFTNYIDRRKIKKGHLNLPSCNIPAKGRSTKGSNLTYSEILESADSAIYKFNILSRSFKLSERIKPIVAMY